MYNYAGDFGGIIQGRVYFQLGGFTGLINPTLLADSSFFQQEINDCP